MKQFLKLATMGVSALVITAGTAGSAAAEYTLNILHINDQHSRVESINRFDSTCDAEDDAAGECFGGFARIKAKIDERRGALTDDGQNVLTLDAGDQFQGSLFYTTYGGTATVEIMNAIGYDAMAVGNHEFNRGPEVLAEFIEAAEFPVISGNTIATDDSPLAGALGQHLVVESGGEQIGIVSVVATDTAELSSPGETISFADEIEYLTGAVAELEAEGVNKIILLSHVGLPRDREIAAAVDGIDIIVGGHSHTLLSNTDEDAADTYPVFVANPSGQDVPIVQAYAYSKYLGEVRVTFDDDGNVIRATGEPHLLDASVTPDEAIAARIAELKGPIEELMNEVVGDTAGFIEGDRAVCRAQECEMGNLVSDAMLDRVRDQGIQVAIQNGGGLRASIDEGEITMGEVMTVLPFQNTLATFQLSGADIIASLENGVSQIEDGAGRFPQVSGLMYNFDVEAEPGSRISGVMVADDAGEFAPIDESAMYGVVSNNFMRKGGDGYALFADNAENAYDFGPGLEEVVADYLTANNPYTPFIDGRITAGMAGEAAMEDEGEMAEEAEAPVVVPETGLATTDLTTSGPEIEVAAEPEDAPAEEAAEVVVEVPETGLATTDLTTSGPEIEAAAEDAATEEADTADVQVEVPETGLATTDLTTSGPEIDVEAEEAASEDAAVEAEAVTSASDSATVTVVVPETGLEAGDLSTAGPAIEEAAEEAAEATEDAMTDEATTEDTMADDMASEEATTEEAMTDDAAAEDAMEMAERTHVIVAGDSLWELARTYYDDATMWTKLADANPDVDASNLEIGTELVVPE